MLTEHAIVGAPCVVVLAVAGTVAAPVILTAVVAFACFVATVRAIFIVGIGARTVGMYGDVAIGQIRRIRRGR